MIRINVYIPIATGQTIPSMVIKGINGQSMVRGIYPIDTPFDGNFFRSQASSRNAILDRFIASEDEYCIMMDRDIEFLDRDAIGKMVKFLTENSYVGGVALCKAKGIRPEQLQSPHTCISCMALRRKAVLGLRFKDPGRECICLPWNRDIRAKGWWFGYLTTGVLIREIRIDKNISPQTKEWHMAQKLIQLATPRTIQVEGVDASIKEISIRSVMVDDAGQIRVGIAPAAATNLINGGTVFQQGNLIPEQKAVFDAFIDLAAQLVSAKVTA
jgi:hypothetical protein